MPETRFKYYFVVNVKNNLQNNRINVRFNFNACIKKVSFLKPENTTS